MSMKEKIDRWLSLLPNMTKQEADYLEEIMKWDNEKKTAFILAKRIFEEKEDVSKNEMEVGRDKHKRSKKLFKKPKTD